jgi:hypothetical protein
MLARTRTPNHTERLVNACASALRDFTNIFGLQQVSSSLPRAVPGLLLDEIEPTNRFVAFSAAEDGPAQRIATSS